MKIQHPMEHEVDEAARTIDFEVNLKTPGALDQIRFVVFLAGKFEAEVAHVGQIMKDDRYPFGTVELRFPNAEKLRAAASFSDDNLTESGLTIRDKQDEIALANAHSLEAEELLRRMSEAPPAEKA